jgi:hypothetical protein
MSVTSEEIVLRVGPAKWMHGGVIKFGRYGSGELAMQIVNEMDGQPEAKATVALVPDAEHPGEFSVWLKGWSENEGIPEALEKAGIVKLTGRTFATGHVVAQHAELTEAARAALAKAGV